MYVLRIYKEKKKKCLDDIQFPFITASSSHAYNPSQKIFRPIADLQEKIDISSHMESLNFQSGNDETA